jgi:hypothetical protein
MSYEVSSAVVATSAEARFKVAVVELVAQGVYPSPGAINHRLGRDLYNGKPSHNINGRECRWRREVCAELRFVLNSDRRGWNMRKGELSR